MESQCTTTTTAGNGSTGSLSAQQQISTAPAGVSVSSTSSPSVVIPVPIVEHEATYAYIAVKGSLHDSNCSVFGLDREETRVLSLRFASGSVAVANGVMVRGTAIDVINTISKLGYKVVSSTGEAEITWTMQREV